MEIAAAGSHSRLRKKWSELRIRESSAARRDRKESGNWKYQRKLLINYWRTANGESWGFRIFSLTRRIKGANVWQWVGWRWSRKALHLYGGGVSACLCQCCTTFPLLSLDLFPVLCWHRAEFNLPHQLISRWYQEENVLWTILNQCHPLATPGCLTNAWLPFALT